MTMGTYILRFKGTDQVYVGQAVDIERRYTIHLRKLKNGSANYKLQKAYATFGVPQVELLTEASKEELNSLEEEAFELFDSVKNGFNLASKADIHLEGPDNGAARYTKEEIIIAFEALLAVDTYKNISLTTGIDENTLRHIANGESHSWLEREFPDKYVILKSYMGTEIRRQYGNSAKARGITYPPIVSPEGTVYIVENVLEFSKLHGLDASCLSKVMRSVPKYKTHKGWKLKDG